MLVVLACVVVSPERAVLVLLVAACAAGAWQWWRARERRAATRRTADGVLEACEQLAAELAAGQPPGPALDRVAQQWDLWLPVAAAHRMGADVAGSLRAAASIAGAGELHWIAAAWQVAQRTGQGLAGALDATAADLRAARATRSVVEGELASARSTAQLLCALPVVALLLGSGIGGDPWGFLVATPAGLGCLAGGLAFGAAGLAWIERIAGSVERS